MASKKREIPQAIPLPPGLLENPSPFVGLTPSQMQNLSAEEAEDLYQKTFTPYGHRYNDAWANVILFMMAMILPEPEDDPDLREPGTPILRPPTGHQMRGTLEPFDKRKWVAEVISMGDLAGELYEEVLAIQAATRLEITEALEAGEITEKQIRARVKANHQARLMAVVARWNEQPHQELPTLCQWCGQPVILRAPDPRTGCPAVFCRDECRKTAREHRRAQDTKSPRRHP